MLLLIDIKVKLIVLYDPSNEIDTYITIPINQDSLFVFNELIDKGMLIPAKFHCSFIETDIFSFAYKITHVGVILSLAYSVGLDKLTLGRTDRDD